MVSQFKPYTSIHCSSFLQHKQGFSAFAMWATSTVIFLWNLWRRDTYLFSSYGYNPLSSIGANLYLPAGNWNPGLKLIPLVVFNDFFDFPSRKSLWTHKNIYTEWALQSALSSLWFALVSPLYTYGGRWATIERFCEVFQPSTKAWKKPFVCKCSKEPCAFIERSK